jgi:hypothetical protein|nr:MAG TPA: nucleoporin [Caudoviricetes sp.]
MYLFFILQNMKEKIAKLAALNSQLITKIQEDNKEEVLKISEQIAEVHKELETEVDETDSKNEEVEKTANTVAEVKKTVNAMQEQITKYADLFVSADSIEGLKEDLKSLFEEKVKKLEERVETLEGLSPSSNQQQDVNKSADDPWDFNN